MLRDFGFDVCEAAHGREALAQLEAPGHVDLAFVDWNMPEMNGLEFVIAARADARFATVPFVMCTSHTEMSQIVAALEAGATEYIMKPFTKDILRDKLEIIGMSVG
jgi:two-component system chemotaxis response regulator CheY